MKKLTKEQHDAICEWITKFVGCSVAKEFQKDFKADCCDSCADGHTCESDSTDMLREKEVKEFLGL